MTSHLWGDHDDTCEVDCRSMCPTIEAYPTAWPLWLLAFLYYALLIYAIVLLFRAKSQQNMSLRVAFLVLQAIFCFLRALHLTIHFDWSFEVLIFFAGALPMIIQFVTMSLLVIFMIKCLLLAIERQDLLYKLVYPVYAFVLVAVAASSGVFVGYACRNEPHSGKGYDRGLSFFSALVFGILAIVTGIVGYFTQRTLMRVILNHHMRDKVVGASRVIVVYFITFLLRAFWNIAYSFGFNALQHGVEDLAQSHRWTELYVVHLSFFGFFEVLPTVYLFYNLRSWCPRGREYLGETKGQNINSYDPSQPLTRV
eukprot:m.156945 g.156945  ORF g.156945 m.156945 type:complete len:311 (+) comp10223_c0_seq2:178-1110(+)